MFGINSRNQSSHDGTTKDAYKENFQNCLRQGKDDGPGLK